MKRLIGLILVLAGVLYPFAVYWGTEHFAPWQFALLLGSLWLASASPAAWRWRSSPWFFAWRWA